MFHVPHRPAVFLSWLQRERDEQAKSIFDPSAKEPLAPSAGELHGLSLPCHLPAKPVSLFSALGLPGAEADR